MTAFFRSLIAALALLPTLGAAQTYPSRGETPVTDDAEVISPVAEAELAARLTAISQENNAEVVVVTLPSTALYTAGDDLADYAPGLMADWGLGDTTGGRGVLILVFDQDRELRIEAGTGFSADAQATTTAIMTDTMIPGLRDAGYETGIADTVEAIAERLLVAGDAAPTTEPAPVAEAAPEAEPAPDAATTDAAEEGGSNILIWIGGGIAALVALVVGANKRSAAKLAATPCPSCGETGLTRDRVTLQEATEYREGHGETRTTCPHCGHVDADPFTIRQREADKPEKSGKAASRDPVRHGTTKGGPGPKGKGGIAPKGGVDPKGGGGGASGEW